MQEILTRGKPMHLHQLSHHYIMLIPMDTLYVIFQNLEPADLIKAKSVCKSWLSTIGKNDSFMELLDLTRKFVINLSFTPSQISKKFIYSSVVKDEEDILEKVKDFIQSNFLYKENELNLFSLENKQKQFSFIFDREDFHGENEIKIYSSKNIIFVGDCAWSRIPKFGMKHVESFLSVNDNVNLLETDERKIIQKIEVLKKDPENENVEILNGRRIYIQIEQLWKERVLQEKS